MGAIGGGGGGECGLRVLGGVGSNEVYLKTEALDGSTSITLNT